MVTCQNFGCMILKLVLIFGSVQSAAWFPFETCSDFGSTFVGTGKCSELPDDGAVGAATVRSVWVQDGYLDYGETFNGYGCPFKANACPAGFSYYGWMKFDKYPNNTNGTQFAVLVSTPVFNLHILSSGRVGVYAWLPDGTEYYVENLHPVILNVWHPFIVEFRHDSLTKVWRLIVMAQAQVKAESRVGRPRSYTPPTDHLVFGGSGVKSDPHSASVHFDRTFLDSTPQEDSHYFQSLLDVASRKFSCAAKSGAQTRPLTCYWVEQWPRNWTDAYRHCKSVGYSSGYPNAKLAQFPSWNNSVWNAVVPKISMWGNGSALGFKAWIGGGHNLQWLNMSMAPVGGKAVVPFGVKWDNSTSSPATCLQLDTRKNPWEWSEAPCDLEQKYVCQMSYDCLPESPCKNFGICQPENDGYNICKCLPGTSGQFCENGTLQLSKPKNCTNCAFLLPVEETSESNCTKCSNKIEDLVSVVAQLKMKLVRNLIDIGISAKGMKPWENAQNEMYNDLLDAASDNIEDIFGPDNCSSVWYLYSTFLFERKMICWYTKLLQNETTKLPADVNDIWSKINRSTSDVMALDCYKNVVSDNLNKTELKSLMQFLNSDGNDVPMLKLVNATANATVANFINAEITTNKPGTNTAQQFNVTSSNFESTTVKPTLTPVIIPGTATVQATGSTVAIATTKSGLVTAATDLKTNITTPSNSFMKPTAPNLQTTTADNDNDNDNEMVSNVSSVAMTTVKPAVATTLLQNVGNVQNITVNVPVAMTTQQQIGNIGNSTLKTNLQGNITTIKPVVTNLQTATVDDNDNDSDVVTSIGTAVSKLQLVANATGVTTIKPGVGVTQQSNMSNLSFSIITTKPNLQGNVSTVKPIVTNLLATTVDDNDNDSDVVTSSGTEVSKLQPILNVIGITTVKPGVGIIPQANMSNLSVAIITTKPNLQGNVTTVTPIVINLLTTTVDDNDNDNDVVTSSGTPVSKLQPILNVIGITTVKPGVSIIPQANMSNVSVAITTQRPNLQGNVATMEPILSNLQTTSTSDSDDDVEEITSKSTTVSKLQPALNTTGNTTVKPGVGITLQPGISNVAIAITTQPPSLQMNITTIKPNESNLQDITGDENNENDENLQTTVANDNGEDNENSQTTIAD